MTFESYKKASLLLDQMNDCKRYIYQFQSSLNSVPADIEFESTEEREEFEKDRNLMIQSVSDLTESLKVLEAEFAAL